MFPFLWNMSWKTVSCRAQLHTGQPVRFHPLNHQHYDQTTAWTLSGLVLDSLVFSSLKQQNSVVTSSDYAPIPILPGFSQFCLKILNHNQYCNQDRKNPNFDIWHFQMNSYDTYTPNRVPEYTCWKWLSRKFKKPAQNIKKIKYLNNKPWK